MPTESKNPYRQHLPDGTTFDLIHVKGGSYFFGDFRFINVTIPDFCIGKYPVTQALWQAVMGDNPAHFKGKNRPIENISWYDAAAFCNVLNALTGNPSVYFRDEKFIAPLDYGMTLPLKHEDISVFQNPRCPGYRLPSETQWEYTARGGAKSGSYEYVGSGKLEEVGWYDQNSHGETKPVGLKAPNELGIHEMSGNVWEWCADQYTKNILSLPQNGAAYEGDEIVANRVFRGSSWLDSGVACRPSSVSSDHPRQRYNIIGFRVVLFPPPASIF